MKNFISVLLDQKSCAAFRTLAGPLAMRLAKGTRQSGFMNE